MNKEWENEPNYIEWEYRGVKCEIRRLLGFKGALCGYCYLPKNHPWKKLSDEEFRVITDAIEVHCGISCTLNDKIGFDCGHGLDWTPFDWNIPETHYDTHLICKELQMNIYDDKNLDQDSKNIFSKLVDVTHLNFYKNNTINIELKNYSLKEAVYRNIEYVKKETEHMVDQMLTAATDNQ